MKKILVTIGLMLLGIMVPGSLAASQVTVTIEGVPVNFDGQPATIVDDRVLVPVRGVFELLGFDVIWDQAMQSATLSRDGLVIVIIVGEPEFVSNGLVLPMPVPAQIINGRTMLPIRAVLQSAGYYVDWNGPERTVLISQNPIIIPIAVQKQDALAYYRSVLTARQDMQFETLAFSFEPSDIYYAQLVDLSGDGIPDLIMAIGQSYWHGYMDTYRLSIRTYTGGMARGMTWHDMGGHGGTTSAIMLAETRDGQMLIIDITISDADDSVSRRYFRWQSAMLELLLHTVLAMHSWGAHEPLFYVDGHAVTQVELDNASSHLDIISYRHVIGENTYNAAAVVAQIDALLADMTD